VPKAFPKEFRRDVVAVARKGEAPIRRIAKDFGISESCLQRWLKIADVEDGSCTHSGRPLRHQPITTDGVPRRKLLVELNGQLGLPHSR
jgi:transposase